MSVNLQSGFQLGDYEVEPLRGQLSGPSGSKHIHPKAMEVLIYLADHPQVVVEREEIMHYVWGNATVSDNALTHCISELRHALDDHREDPNYIQTVPKRGYRLVAIVRSNIGKVANDTEAVAAFPNPLAARDERKTRSPFWDQLQRRRVVQVSISYTLVAWIIIEVTSVIFPQLPLPDWSMQLVIVLAVLGFPIALVMAWALQITPEGIELDTDTYETPESDAPTKLQALRAWTAVGIVALVGLAVAWHYVESRVSFVARDWIVLAELDNRTSDPSMGQALDLAFRIGLKQSRYANVLPRSSVRGALARMQRDPNVALDPATGIEVALREGAKILIIGSIVEIGGNYLLSAEIVDPFTDRTITVKTVNVDDPNDLLQKTDQLTLQVRRVLGESLAEIERDTMALEKVTTSNLEALKAYSAGVQFAQKGRGDEALVLLQRATDLDPGFAMAHASLGTLYRGALENGAKAQEEWEKALAYSDRLTKREKLYIEAALTWHGDPSEMVRTWGLLSSAYPDQAAGHHNLGLVYWEYESDFESAHDAFAAATALPSKRAPSFYYLGYSHLALGNLDEAARIFETGWQLDQNPMEFSVVDMHTVLGEYADAEAFIREHLSSVPIYFQYEAQMRQVSLLADQGRFDEALAVARRVLETAEQNANRRITLNSQVAIIALLERKSDAPSFQAQLEDHVHSNLGLLSLDAAELDYSPVPQLALLGKIAARNGHYHLAQQVLDAIKAKTDATDAFVWASWGLILQAELDIAQGRNNEAIAKLSGIVETREFFQARESLARAFSLAGITDEAIANYEWIVGNRGLAFAESFNRFYGKEFNIIDLSMAWYQLGRLYSSNGDTDKAEQAFRELIEHWKDGDSDLPILQEIRYQDETPEVAAM